MTDRHEEAIEKAAAAAWTYDVAGINHGWEDELARMKDAYREQARAAVTAYLDHALPEVTSVEDVENLPVGTVVLNANSNAWQRAGRNWYVAGASGGQKAVPHLPARVIWWPR